MSPAAHHRAAVEPADRTARWRRHPPGRTALPGGSRARGGGERGKQLLDAGQGGGAADVEDLEAWMAEIGAWYDKHSSSGKLADSRHQLDWPDKAKTARASEV